MIQINENVRIRPEENNYTLEQRRIIKEGKNAGQEVWSVVGYYGTLDQAANQLFLRHTDLLLPENVQDLKVLSLILEEVGAEIARACSDYVRSKAA